MRSTFFVILSIAFHALCVAAVAIAPSKIAPQEGSEVEVVMGEPALQPGAEVAQAEVTNAPEVKAEPVVETKTVVKKAKKVAAAAPAKVTESKTTETKVVETKITELPSKEALPEELDPDLGEEQMVTLVPAAKKAAGEEKAELIPVKEKVAGVEAATSDEDTEATTATEELEGSEDPSAASPAGASADKKSDGKAELAQGGSTKAGAISYLDLKQAQGNKAPVYPFQARKEARQGQVELLYRVTKAGNVTDLQVIKSSGHKDLDQEAVKAVAAFRFVPGQEGWARHPVAFTLKGSTTTLPSQLRSNNAQTE